MKYPFGQDFTLDFYPWLDEEPISGVPAQTASLHLFDNLPNTDDAQSGTGAVKSSTCVYTSGNYFSFEVPAIDDPNGGASSVNVSSIYYAAANFILEAGGQTQTVVFPVTLGQVEPKIDKVTVSVEYIQNLYPQILTFLSEAEVTAQIDNAFLVVVNLIKSKGYDFGKIRKLKQLDQLVALKALSDALATQIMQTGDKFDNLSEKYKQDFNTTLSGLMLEYGDVLQPLTVAEKKIGGSIEVIR